MDAEPGAYSGDAGSAVYERPPPRDADVALKLREEDDHAAKYDSAMRSLVLQTDEADIAAVDAINVFMTRPEMALYRDRLMAYPTKRMLRARQHDLEVYELFLQVLADRFMKNAPGVPLPPVPELFQRQLEIFRGELLEPGHECHGKDYNGVEMCWTVYKAKDVPYQSYFLQETVKGSGIVFLCWRTGHVHICDFNCPGDITNDGSGMRICSISGLCKQAIHTNWRETMPYQLITIYGGEDEFNDNTYAPVHGEDDTNKDAYGDAPLKKRARTVARRNPSLESIVARVSASPNVMPVAAMQSSSVPLPVITPSVPSGTPSRPLIAPVKPAALPAFDVATLFADTAPADATTPDEVLAKAVRDRYANSRRVEDDIRDKMQEVAIKADLAYESAQPKETIATQMTLRAMSSSATPMVVARMEAAKLRENLRNQAVTTFLSTTDRSMAKPRMRRNRDYTDDENSAPMRCLMACVKAGRMNGVASLQLQSVFSEVISDLLTGPEACKARREMLRKSENAAFNRVVDYVNAQAAAKKPAFFTQIVARWASARERVPWQFAHLESMIHWRLVCKYYTTLLERLWHRYAPYIIYGVMKMAPGEKAPTAWSQEPIKFAVGMLFFLARDIYVTDDSPPVTLLQMDPFLEDHLMPPGRVTQAMRHKYQSGWVNQSSTIRVACEMAVDDYRRLGRLEELEYATLVKDILSPNCK